MILLKVTNIKCVDLVTALSVTTELKVIISLLFQEKGLLHSLLDAHRKRPSGSFAKSLFWLENYLPT